MESQVSPKNIEERVEKMAAASAAKPVETPEVKVETPAVETKVEAKVEPKVEEKVEPKVEAKVEPKVETKVEAKVEPKVEPKTEKKQPNDPKELRAWATKLSQENATLRDDVKSIRAAIEKLTKKPVDYAELAKNPDGLKAHIEAERQEAVSKLQAELDEKSTLAAKNETMYERTLRERDTENYPRWEKLFPLIQTLAANGDGRINWNQAPGAALDEAYALAEKLSPAEIAAAAPVEEVKPAVAGMTEEQVNARIAEAVAKAVEKTRAEVEAGLRAEANGGGLGSLGKGGKRDTNVSNDALKKMPLKDLKNLISK